MAMAYDEPPHRLAFSDIRHVSTDNQDFVLSMRDRDKELPPPREGKDRVFNFRERGGGEGGANAPELREGMKRIAELQEAINGMRQDAKDMAVEMETLKEREAAADAEHEEVTQRIDDAQADLQESKDYLKKLKKQLQKSDGAVAKLKKQSEDLQAENQMLMKKFEEMRAAKLKGRDKSQWWPPPWFDTM